MLVIYKVIVKQLLILISLLKSVLIYHDHRPLQDQARQLVPPQMGKRNSTRVDTIHQEIIKQLLQEGTSNRDKIKVVRTVVVMQRKKKIC